ncbi:MAG: hypothetical protein KDA21_02480 [Phycisphaerales bacterium]|nr:hypothetical protein [Phycisphaerales bacterium]
MTEWSFSLEVTDMDVGGTQPLAFPGGAPARGLSEQEARRMFQRTLSAWAMDLLSLRQRGLDRPGARPYAVSSYVPAPTRRAA